MEPTVSFVDTSILCNLLPVYGRDQDRLAVLAEMSERLRRHDILILPVTAIIETGNFIAQVNDGRIRRTNATTLKKMLDLVLKNQAPWQLHSFTWGEEFLRSYVRGDGIGMTLAESMMREIGGGDLCILAERELYKRRTRLTGVEIWTLDTNLSSYS